jgi:Domain of unknown function (DUF397)
MSEHPDQSRSRRAGKATWRKASRCQQGECLEISEHDGKVMLRDSSDPEVVLRLDAASWRAFAEAIIVGEFDDLG